MHEVCRRELFDELSRLLGELDAATIGADGFVPFVRKEFYTYGRKSKRIRDVEATLTATIGRLRELSGLLASEVETPSAEEPPPAPAEAPAVEPGDITTEELVARLESPPVEVTPAVETPEEPEEWFDLENPPVVVHPPGTDLRTPVEPLAPAPVETRAPPGFVWVGLSGQRVLLPLFDEGPPVPPRRSRPDLYDPPAPVEAPPPVAPAPVEAQAPALPADPPPAPVEAPPGEVVPGSTTPAPAPVVPASLETGGSVKLLDFAKETRFREGAWSGLVSVLPEDEGNRGAYVATANVVIDASRVPNKRALAKLLAKVEKGREDEAKRVPFAKVVALVHRVSVIEDGSRPLNTLPESTPEPIAFEADGTRYVSLPTTHGARVLVKLDYFLMCRGLLTGTPVRWYAMPGKLPSARPTGKGWAGVVARLASTENDAERAVVVATITEADLTLSPAQAASLIEQRAGLGGGDFAKFSRG